MIWVLGCLMILSIVMGACGTNIESESIGELAQYYTSTDDLWVDSDLVVIGIFDDQERIIEPNSPRDPDSKPPYDPGRRELSFRITDTLKGNSDGQIWIAQRASFQKDNIKPLADDTLFKPGEKYVLFLRSSKQQPGAFFWVTGATQGAFSIVNDKVYSRSVTGDIPADIGPTIDGVLLDNFINEFKD